ncbi:uncharacterized protein H6S33_008638 [Morchella sextelata]|uniref:uncharacterized protein n=1 Tax=Morchella sextelata TaxID=1174677 RepID=UPI001D05951F|nr:uncharacterized protein H6S33_008638 [Morchella sextelata]KAH0602557.1 hypothetical protein H6S33_008638 [Morchella sextelata]
MNINTLLSNEPVVRTSRTYNSFAPEVTTPYHNSAAVMTPPKSLSPTSSCKSVHFRICGGVSEPKTLHIFPHDTTESITTTVKNMFALSTHKDSALSFQDPEGKYMILQHENFEDGMTVFVRVEEAPHRYSYEIHPSLLNHLEPSARSVSPSAARGRRSASTGGRSKALKRPASSHNWEYKQERFDSYAQTHLPGVSVAPLGFMTYEEEQRNRLEPLASAEISLDNILEGSRRKRPKFSSDELPLYPPTALPRNDGSSASSASPTRPVGEVTTPYTHRNYGYPHPTPPSAYGGYPGNSAQVQNPWPQSRTGGNGAFPTPAPTIASCISDEEVAVQLMRLGGNRIENCSVTTSTREDNYEEEEEEGFSSGGGEYGDDGRSDTTELPDPLNNEILPSFDTTEPSDNEDLPSPPIPSPHTQQLYSYRDDPPRVESHRPYAIGAEEEEEYEDLLDDDADETYIGKEEEEEDDDADYDEDLDDVPLMKTVRGRKLSSAPSAPSAPPSNAGISLKTKPALPKGFVRATKRKNQPTLQTNGLKKPRPLPETQWPISPASPPSSLTLTLTTPTSLYGQQTATPVDDRPHQHHLGPDEPSMKPRCQRCRKSKKGCDRARPCQRCKDAGIGADGCISEDEAGTRRGRQAAAAARKAAAGGGVGVLGKLKSKTKKKKILVE